jgi:hypothetical protein
VGGCGHVGHVRSSGRGGGGCGCEKGHSGHIIPVQRIKSKIDIILKKSGLH